MDWKLGVTPDFARCYSFVISWTMLFLESDACLSKYLGVKGYLQTSSLVFSALATQLFATSQFTVSAFHEHTQ